MAATNPTLLDQFFHYIYRQLIRHREENALNILIFYLKRRSVYANQGAITID